jgi:hypothetical protein
VNGSVQRKMANSQRMYTPCAMLSKGLVEKNETKVRHYKVVENERYPNDMLIISALSSCK